MKRRGSQLALLLQQAQQAGALDDLTDDEVEAMTVGDLRATLDKSDDDIAQHIEQGMTTGLGGW